jgi:hypothetical protein
MNRTPSLARRRRAVVVNYLSLIILSVSIMASEYRWGTVWPFVGIFLSLAGFIVTFVQVYGRTGLWKFVHLPLKELDERETQLIYRTLQVAYTIFTVVALLYILALTLKIQFFAGLTDPSGDFSFGNVVFAVFIYLSHILPASIIAWNERQVLL